MREVLTGLVKRRLADVATARFAEEPVLILNGPRTVGKSTLLSQLAERLGRTVIDCDDPSTRSAVRADPGRFVETGEPVLIDEYQHVPELLDASSGGTPARRPRPKPQRPRVQGNPGSRLTISLLRSPSSPT